MSKKNFLTTILFVFVFSLNAISQNWININSPVAKSVSVIAGNSDVKNTSFTVSVDGFNLQQAAKAKINEFFVNVEGATPLLIEGAPDLPKVSVPVIIPDMDKMEVKITSSSYKDFENIDIAPSKGNLTRDINPSDVPYKYGDAYNKDKFFPGKLAELDDPYIIRDYRAQSVKLFPFQYNPVTKTLRVYYSLKVEVKSVSDKGVNQFLRTKVPTTVDADFDRIYSREFINYQGVKYTPLAEQGKMLIICYDNFMSAMQPFVQWKNTIGIPTVMVSKTTAGSTAAAIKTYVANYYNTNGLTYLLLVGDHSQIPSNSLSSGYSDNAYGYITGSDKYQEIFVGRFSAESVDHVTTMVNRTISYEKTPVTTSGIFNNVIGIGSSQGPGDDSEYDYQHVRNMQTDLMNYTYTGKKEFFDGSQGGVDATGDPTAAMVATAVNAGAGCILYTGHGSETSFVTSGFSSTNVSSLTNQGMWPFIWAVACVNGNFTSATCFAESWLRAGSGTSSPKGAIATLMSTINQSWNPPMAGQDEMIDILTETYPANIKRTFGGISVNGLFKMNDEYSTSGYEMTDTWTVFGDPSVMVRTDDPATMTVSHASSVILGSSSLQVNCDVEGAYVALTINNQIIGAGYVSSGSANISFPALTSTDSIVVAVTAFNYIPYIGGVTVITASGPHISYKSNTISDPSGNNNGQADYSESILLNVTLENNGVSAASGVNAVLSTTDTYVTITNSTHSWGAIAAGSQLLQNGAFAVTVAGNVPNNHSVNFNIDITDNASNSWTGNFNMIVNAPDLSAGNVTVNDASGNNNGRLDPSEADIININTLNNGNADAVNATGTLTTTSPYITITNNTYNFGNIVAGNSAVSAFNITVNSQAILGSTADFTYQVTAGNYSATKNFSLMIGLVDEDWETGNFTKFNWVQGGNKNWSITNSLPYEGTYCAKSGSISNSQTSAFSITVNVVAADSISFYKKVSSEESYDFLTFYIDNLEQGTWSGEQSWSRSVYPVSSGTRTFKWEYSKDYYYSDGSDCAWIDYILFPPVYNPVTYNEEHDMISSGSEINIYPNPASEQINIVYYLDNASDINLKLVDAFGKTVAVSAVKNSNPGLYSEEFNVNNLAAGIYFCVLQTNDKMSVKKVMVK